MQGMQVWLRHFGTALSVVAVSATESAAHPTQRVWRGAWYCAWHWDELVMANLGLLGLVYAVGWKRLFARASSESRWQVRNRGGACLCSVLLIAGALQSPLDALGESLGWVHMLQHMLLMSIAAPLFVLSKPVAMWTWGLPHRWRRSGWVQLLLRSVWGTRSRRLWCNVWFAFIIHTLAMWGWHYPACYEAALSNPLVHDLEHLSMFAAGVIFWQAILFPPPAARAATTPMLSVLALFLTSVAGMGLGVLMALSPSVWYGSYLDTTAHWGWTPLEDQQLAGTIMWMPACAVYPLAAIAIFAPWLQRLGEETPAAADPSGTIHSGLR